MLEREPLALTRRDVPDAIFPSDNTDGIPLLDLRMQATDVHLPVMTWGSVKRQREMPGTWHFYTEDYRFEALWRDPSPVVNTRCNAAAEPNFTTSEQMSRAVAVYQIYRKRWIARYWQSRGVPVFVDLNVAPQWTDENLLGVPEGWRAWITRGYEDRLDWTDVEWQLARARCGREDLIFAVYGGGERVAEMCRRYARDGWVYLPETMDQRKGRVLRRFGAEDDAAAN